MRRSFRDQEIQDTMAVNDPDILSLSIPAVTGVANAADLSRLFSLALDGTLIRNSTVEKISTPTLDDWHLERVSCLVVVDFEVTNDRLFRSRFGQ